MAAKSIPHLWACPIPDNAKRNKENENTHHCASAERFQAALRLAVPPWSITYTDRLGRQRKA